MSSNFWKRKGSAGKLLKKVQLSKEEVIEEEVIEEGSYRRRKLSKKEVIEGLKEKETAKEETAKRGIY